MRAPRRTPGSDARALRGAAGEQRSGTSRAPAPRRSSRRAARPSRAPRARGTASGRRCSVAVGRRHRASDRPGGRQARRRRPELAGRRRRRRRSARGESPATARPQPRAPAATVRGVGRRSSRQVVGRQRASRSRGFGAVRRRRGARRALEARRPLRLEGVVRRRGSRGAACRSPAPAPRPRSPAASVIVCSLSSICLVIACANAGPRREPLGPARGASAERASPSGDDAVDEADARAPRSASMRSPKKRSSAARPSPTMRGSRYAAPMSAPERPTLREDEPELGVAGGDAQIARDRDHRAGADRDAVDRGDHRPAAARGCSAISAPVTRVKSSSPRRRARSSSADDVV